MRMAQLIAANIGMNGRLRSASLNAVSKVCRAAERMVALRLLSVKVTNRVTLLSVGSDPGFKITVKQRDTKPLTFDGIIC